MFNVQEVSLLTPIVYLVPKDSMAQYVTTQRTAFYERKIFSPLHAEGLKCDGMSLEREKKNIFLAEKRKVVKVFNEKHVKF